MMVDRSDGWRIFFLVGICLPAKHAGAHLLGIGGNNNAGYTHAMQEL